MNSNVALRGQSASVRNSAKPQFFRTELANVRHPSLWQAVPGATLMKVHRLKGLMVAVANISYHVANGR
jgi:hypothetical protein